MYPPTSRIFGPAGSFKASVVSRPDMGETLFAQGGVEADVADCYHRAGNIAELRSARSLQLRAATSLARLWRDQDRTAEAREVLATIYGWFTEGFDTPDLKDAKAVLDQVR